MMIAPATREISNIVLGLLLLCGIAWSGNALPQTYPTRPVTIVVPFPPGGYVDLIGRVIGQKLSEALGQPVVVENRAGANGIIGTEYTAKSAPDGHTIMVGTQGTHAVNQVLYKKVPYDAERDFAPVVHISNQTNILVVHPSSKFTTVMEVVSAAKARPKTITYGTPGAGSGPHLQSSLFSSLMGIELVHVPYRGAGPATTAMLAGETHFLFGGGTELLPHVKAGKLRALANTGTRRLPALSEVPTMAEAGVPNYHMYTFFGFFAPAGTPRDVIVRLNAEINNALRDGTVRERLSGQGFADLIGGTPEQWAALVKSEMGRLTAIVKESGAVAE